MKIFAKRTKKKAESSAPRTVNKSDPIVEQLLKKDPSEWNAKERRMVKRYRLRKSEESNESNDIQSKSEIEEKGDSDEKAEEMKEDEEKDVEEKEENDDDDENSNDDSSSSSSEKNVEENEENDDDDDDDNDDSSSSSSEDEKSDGKEQINQNDSDGDSGSDESENSNKIEVQHSTTKKEEKHETPVAAESTEDNGKVGKDHEIWGVLDKLNSKQKRTLSRKLDRLGKSALEEVEQEANKILDETMPIEVDSKRDQTEASSTDKNSSDKVEPKKKKRKKGADWSSLPAEERLRREDQRRKQQEAAERRARGESIKPGHKRPLNSQRRRANRRKPKWASKTPSGAPDISDYKKGHHSSGFLHRKNSHTKQQAANNY